MRVEQVERPVATSAHEPISPVASPIACVELDRFCTHCGYNLRTLPVCRDTKTGIPVVQCTECGGFQAANDTSTVLRPWLHRLTSVAVVGWMLLLVAIFAHLALVEGAISYGTLEEQTTWSNSTTRRVGNTTTTTWTNTRGSREVRADDPDNVLFVRVMSGCSVLTAFLFGSLVVVAFPHWHRAAGIGLVLAIPIVVTMLVAYIWHLENPHLFDWSQAYLGMNLGIQLLGGMVGIAFGRPCARLAVRVLLPPSVRPRLAYLWLADNKPFPIPQRAA